MSKQSICISSPPDREKVVAEIFFDEIQWAEINQEGEKLAIEFYPRPDGQPWQLNYSTAINALAEAKLKLTGTSPEISQTQIEFTISQEQIEKSGNCIYHEGDYALEYEFNSNNNRNFLLIYDTLTVVFDTNSGKFVSLDAFTVKEYWIMKNEFVYPEIAGEGILKISSGFGDDDRHSFKFNPRYEFAKNGILKIKVSDKDSAAQFYRIAENLLVGLKDHLITSFIIEGVEIK